MAVEGERSCETCGAPLDGDQHYCLNCGSRAGPRSAQLLRLKRLAAGRSGDPAPGPGGQAPLEPPPEPARGGLRLPAPRISALLVLVFLGFGALLGSAAGSGSGRLSAAVSPRLKLVVPAAGTTPASSSAASEAPSAEPETTPEAATESTATSTPKAASTTKEEAGEKESEEKGKPESSAAKPATKLPAIKHVFVIMLDDEPYSAVFGPESKARYLADTLEHKGELLVRYDAIAHEQLANGIALLSGQGPTAQTAANCPTYSPLATPGAGASGQVIGDGCVYPASTMTLPGQLTARHLSWRAYIEGIDEPGSSAGACAHPPSGAPDTTLTTGDYATFRNPIVYFGSLVSSPSCAADDVGLAALKGDLAGSSTPSLAYIVPDRCHDAGLTPCAPGAPTGPADADSFLESVVPQIMASKAYKSGGLIVITTDEAPSSGEFADSSSCCGQPSSYPNLPKNEETGSGGGSVGALLLSPFVKGATTSQEPYNHFSLLRTIEDIFELKHLGYAGLGAVKALSPSLFTVSAKG